MKRNFHYIQKLLAYIIHDNTPKPHTQYMIYLSQSTQLYTHLFHLIHFINDDCSYPFLLFKIYYYKASEEIPRGKNSSYVLQIYNRCDFEDLACNLNRLHIRLLNLHLRNTNSKHSILHPRFHLIHLSILRQPKPSEKTTLASLNAMPGIILVFLLNFPLSTYLQNTILFDLNFHFLLLHTGKIGLEDVCFRCFLPVNACVGE